MSDSDEDIIQVEKGDSRRKRINIKNIEPIKGINVIKNYSSDSDSMSSASTLVKKTKKVLRRKEKNFYPPPQGPGIVEQDYTAFSNPKKVRQQQEEMSEQASEYESESEKSEYQESEKEEIKPKETWEDKQKMKQDLLIKIQSLEKKGFEFSKKFTMTSNYEEMMFEYQKIKKFVETQAAIKFSRRCLMACVTGLEFLNKKFDPFHIKLEGWSENVMESVDDYDNIFEKLHEKYGGKKEVAPEIELLLTLGGSAFMFHLTNTLLKGPGVGGMLAQNNPNFMANMMGAMSQGMKDQKPPTGQGMAQMYQQQQNTFPKPMDTRTGRQEMQGPHIDRELFNGTPLATNHPTSVGVAPIRPIPVPQQAYYQSPPINDEDRYSIASSDSSLDSVESVKIVKRPSPVTRPGSVTIKKNATKRGKNGGGGLELNIV